MMSSKTNRSRRGYLRLSCAVLALSLVIASYVLIVKWNNDKKTQAMRASLVGTWATDLGAIVQLRPDGQARIRHPKSTSVPVTSFDWVVKNHSMMLVRPRPKTAIGTVRTALIQTLGYDDYAERLEIVEVTPKKAGFQESDAAKRPTQWTRTDDKILDSTP